MRPLKNQVQSSQTSRALGPSLRRVAAKSQVAAERTRLRIRVRAYRAKGLVWLPQMVMTQTKFS